MTGDTYHHALRGVECDRSGGSGCGLDGAMARVDLTWRHKGACNGLDPSVFFPDSEEDADEAKAICAECPVRITCLEHALMSRERDGIWGGTTEKERRRILRHRGKSA